MPELKPRPSVERMAPYVPPTAGRAGKLRLDFNENTVGCSPSVIDFLRENLSAEKLAIYPEYEEARAELAAFFKVPQEEMLFTNGTDEAIQVLVNTYVDDGDDVIVLKPAYAMYRFYSEVAGAAIREIGFHPGDLSFPVDELIAAIRPETKAVFLANPNNPTGTGTTVEALERILQTAPNAAVLVDEAYFEFSGITMIGELNRYPNLFVSRTFSKVYGMAAMRFGCLFSQAGNIRWMHKAQSPYSVNTLAALAARAAIRDTAYVTNYIEQSVGARDLISAGFEKLGIRYFPSKANFVLFEAGDRAVPIRDVLRRRGVLVRDRSYEIAGCVRVTCGTREHAQRFLKELESIW